MSYETLSNGHVRLTLQDGRAMLFSNEKEMIEYILN